MAQASYSGVPRNSVYNLAYNEQQVSCEWVKFPHFPSIDGLVTSAGETDGATGWGPGNWDTCSTLLCGTKYAIRGFAHNDGKSGWKKSPLYGPVDFTTSTNCGDGMACCNHHCITVGTGNYGDVCCGTNDPTTCDDGLVCSSTTGPGTCGCNPGRHRVAKLCNHLCLA